MLLADCDLSAPQNQQDSNFLRLPAELRNRIYQLVLSGYDIKIFYHDDLGMRAIIHRPHKPNRLFDFILGRRVFSLLLVCHQIHAETRLLPFSMNEFVIPACPVFHYFCNVIPPDQLNAITTVRLQIGEQLGNIERDWSGEIGLGSTLISVLRRLRTLETIRKVRLEWTMTMVGCSDAAWWNNRREALRVMVGFELNKACSKRIVQVEFL